MSPKLEFATFYSLECKSPRKKTRTDGQKGHRHSREQTQPCSNAFLKAELTELQSMGKGAPVTGAVQPEPDSPQEGTHRARLASAPVGMTPGLYPYRGKWSLLAS